MMQIMPFNKAIGKILFFFRLCLFSLCFSIIWAPNLLHAQDFDNYQPLRAQGEIPIELTTSSNEKFQKERAKLSKKKMSAKELESQETFLMQTSYLLDEMLLSGNVVFNDPVSEYVTKVKDKLLEGQPELQSVIKTYVVKSQVANAFATHSGILLVNTGLLARLHNEAELAFVLCHEIQHYLKKHPLNVFVKSEELKENMKTFNSNKKGDFMNERSKYSRSVEQEADELGFELYKTSGYSLEAAMGVFDVLAMANQAFDQIPWENDFFEWEMLAFPPDYRKYELDTITTREDANDSLSTHPNIAKRRANIFGRIEAAEKTDGETFLVGPMEFLNARKICRFEISEQYLRGQAYGAAFYNSYLLLTEEPESRYLYKNMARAIYGMAKLKDAEYFEEVHRPADQTEGERQQIQYFWETLNRKEFLILAIRFCWQAHLKNPEDAELIAMSEDLMTSLHENHEATANWLEQAVPSTVPAVVDSMRVAKMQAKQDSAKAQAETAAIDPKAEKAEPKKVEEKKTEPTKNENLTIKEKKEIAKKKREDAYNEYITNRTSTPKNDLEKRNIDYIQWALADLFNDADFDKAWKNSKKVNKTEEKQTTAQKKSSRTLINSLVFVQPMARKFKKDMEQGIDFEASELLLSSHKDMIQKIGTGLKINSIFLDARNLKQGEIEKFNDLVTVREWFSEVINNSWSEEKVINFKSSEMLEISKRMKSRYFVYNGILSYHDKLPDDDIVRISTVSLILWPTSPFLLAMAVKKHYLNYILTLVFDAETGKVVYHDMRKVGGKNPKRAIKSNIFNILNSIKHSSK